MPLLPGKKNIGSNIKELKLHGKRKRAMKQILAIALRVAGVAKKGAIMAAKKKVKKAKGKK